MPASVRMRQKKGSRSRFVKVFASWFRRSVVSRSGQGSSEAPGPSVHGRVCFAPSRQMSSSGSDEKVVSLSLRESRADFPEVSLRLSDPSEWRLAAYSGFCREGNITVLEARSILCAVLHMESNCPLGRLLIRSHDLALVPAQCNGRSTFFTAFSRILTSGFRAGFFSYRSGV